MLPEDEEAFPNSFDQDIEKHELLEKEAEESDLPPQY